MSTLQQLDQQQDEQGGDEMTGATSRRKGASAERELCSLLREYLGVEATRNLKQYQQAGHGDIEQLIGPYMIEVKNHKRLDIMAWWRQAVTAASARNAVPCVAYRLPNRGLYDRWRFVVPIQSAYDVGAEWSSDYRYAADIGLEGFALLAREQGGIK